MRQPLLLLYPLLAACGGGGDTRSAQVAGGEDRRAVQTERLTGLYEGRAQGAERSRMCMVPNEVGGTAFALVTETVAGSCGGAGEAVRTDNRLRLTMTGEEQCTIDAQIDGTQVAFPATLPAGCAYYCGSGATLAGAVFDKTGGTVEEAMRASDLAGEPLCG